MSGPDSGATVIAFVSQKAGWVKALCHAGSPAKPPKAASAVKIADLDRQQELGRMASPTLSTRVVEPIISVEGFKTADQALAQVNRYDLLIIDAPARASEGTQKIAQRAALVVQPTNPRSTTSDRRAVIS